MRVEIHKNSNGDSRTAPNGTNFNQFFEARIAHKNDVKAVMQALSGIVKQKGEFHDWTSIEYAEELFKDFSEVLNNGAVFENGRWWNRHINSERHHLISRCPDDVNLLDVIEMIVDCVCAGKTRSGEVRDLEISTDILEKALKNTVKMIDDMVVAK